MAFVYKYRYNSFLNDKPITEVNLKQTACPGSFSTSILKKKTATFAEHGKENIIYYLKEFRDKLQL